MLFVPSLIRRCRQVQACSADHDTDADPALRAALSGAGVGAPADAFAAVSKGVDAAESCVGPT